LHVHSVDLTGLETLLLSDTSKITELDIHRFYWRNRPPSGFPRVLRALARRPTLIKLGLRRYPLCLDNARLLRMALCDILSLQSLDLTDSTLGSADNTSIEVLDMSYNELGGMDSAEILRDVLRTNKTITALGLSGNRYGETTGAVVYIADGLGSNSTLLKINLSDWHLRDGGVSIMAQSLDSRNMTLQKHSPIIPLHQRALACFSKRWNRAVGKQRVAKPHTPLSILLRYWR
jgi:hypothetical protein